MIEVIRCGLLTTVQDLGRFGYEMAGVSPSGAMDATLAEVANAIVGNSEDAAVLELTWIGPELLFTDDAWIAICGADMDAKVDGTSVPRNRIIQVSSGAKLTFAAAKHGARTILAVAGGIDVPLVLGSRSTHVHARMGGYEGRALRPGDVLKTGILRESTATWLRKQPMRRQSNSVQVSSWAVRFPHELSDGLLDGLGMGDGLGGGVAHKWGDGLGGLGGGSGGRRANGDDWSEAATIRLIPGPEFLWFSDETRQMLTTTPYQLTQASNRMGYRLAGMPLSHAHNHHLWSSAVTFGTVQVPPDGQPVILMAERQTTGGYPRLGVVASVDGPRLAQLRPGHQVRFTWIDVRAAQLLLKKQRNVVSQLKTLLRHSGGVC